VIRIDIEQIKDSVNEFANGFAEHSRASQIINIIAV
jgi:hypothetical protein